MFLQRKVVLSEKCIAGMRVCSSVDIDFKGQYLCLHTTLSAYAPSASGPGHFPCKPAGSGGQPGAEGQPYRWGTLDGKGEGKTTHLPLDGISTYNIHRHAANDQIAHFDVCTAVKMDLGFKINE